MKQCVYKQIVEEVKRMCELGLYEDDGRLPSCRELAESLGVNPNTVQRAYAQLEQDGYVSSSPKKGYFATAVSEGKKYYAAAERVKELKASGITREELCKLIDDIYGGEL